MNVCLECGATLPDAAGQCPNCGAYQTGASFETAAVECENCGERIAGDADACPACGALRSAAQCTRHPEKSALGQCVICGTLLCEECNQGGETHFLCENHSEIPVVNGWSQIYSTSDELEADLIRENLKAEGIDSRVLSQKDHFSLPVDLGELSQVRVLVPAYAYQEAERVLEQHRNAAGEVAFGTDDEPVTA